MFVRKPRYEIGPRLGGDSELGNEKEHIGGYGGEEGFLKKLGGILRKPITFGADVRHIGHHGHHKKHANKI